MSTLRRTAHDAARLARRPATVAAALYVVLTVVLTYPLSVHPATTSFPGGGDRNLFVWTLAWNAHAFLHQPLALFDANIFHPYHRTLAYSENLIGAALLVAPVQWLMQNPWLTFNLSVLATVPLCALGGFVLARRLGASPTAAWICGLVYGFAPPRFLRIDQAHLTSVAWIPFCLAYVHSYLATGRRTDLRIAIAFLSLQVLTSGHGAVFLLFGLGVLLLVEIARGTPIRPLTRLRDVGLPGALLLVPVAAVFLPYRIVQTEVGLRRELGDWTGSWTSYLASPTHVDAFILEHLGSLGAYVATNAQAYLFPGWLPLVLAVAAFLPRARTTHEATIELAGAPRLLTVCARLLELGILATLALAVYAQVTGATRVEVGPLTIALKQVWRAWGVSAVLVGLRVMLRPRVPFKFPTRVVTVTRSRETHPRDARLVYGLLLVGCALLAVGPPYGPWRYLYSLPGLSFIRVPSRFMILGMLGLGVLCAFGAERVLARWSGRTRLAVTALVTMALAAEFAVAPFEVVPVPWPNPGADRWLASQPRPFVVAEVPPMDPTIPMLHSMEHWQKTVHGYSGWTPPLSADIAAQLTHFPDEPSLAALTRLGVTHVVVHTSMYPQGEWPAAATALEAWRHRLTVRYADEEGRVYTLEPERTATNQAPSSDNSTRTWQPRSRMSVAPGTTSAGRNPVVD